LNAIADTLPTTDELEGLADYDNRRNRLLRVPAIRNLRYELTNSAMRLD
jgi:hypothetical protein